jgi:carbamoyltransferase
MNAIGIGGHGTEAACAVMSGGRLRSAVELRKLGLGGNPRQAWKEAVRLAGLEPEAITHAGLARPAREHELDEVRAMFPRAVVSVHDHHLAHAASAYFASPFDRATVLTLDSGGDLVNGQLWRAEGKQLNASRQLLWPDSVAGVYSRVTRLLGFDARADEHKVQWLSCSGDSRFVPLFEAILGTAWGGLDLSYLRTTRTGLDFSRKFYDALGLEPGAEVPAALRAHVAAGIQRAAERHVIEMAGSGDNLCLAGGLFFNVLLVRAIEESGRWMRVFVQPAAGNSGTAIGAAFLAAGPVHDELTTLALGPAFAPEEIKQVIENCKLRFRFLLTAGDVVSAGLDLLEDNRIVAWMQGRMEFGPRALGNRSLLASPLDPFASENLNIYIKRRETFRKFAAAVPAERASAFFDVSSNGRFLASLGRVRSEHRERFASALLGDDLLRVHVVEERENPLFHRLLTEFGQRTGLPVLYNTSFNLFGDPLVCTPRDAVRSFYSSGIDSLICGNFLVEK